MTKPWEDLVRRFFMYILAVTANEIPTILFEISFNGLHFCVIDVFWNKVR